MNAPNDWNPPLVDVGAQGVGDLADREPCQGSAAADVEPDLAELLDEARELSLRRAVPGTHDGRGYVATGRARRDRLL